MKREGLGTLSAAHWVPISFLSLITVGTLVLKLPFCSATGHISLVDSLFTATSATCVTGLVVVDTGSYFSPIGQAVVLLLLQVGGLGIATFGTFFLLSRGMRFSMSAREALEDSIGRGSVQSPSLKNALCGVLLITAVAEFIGAVVLLPVFLQQRSLGHSAWSALFHSVSAYCNAGFGLYSDSMAGYRGSLVVNLVICSLTVVGGLGYVVVTDVMNGIRGKNGAAGLTLHSRVVLWTTLVLVFAGAGAVFAIERSASFAEMPLKEKMLGSFFQSICARTSGFSTVNIGAMAAPALLVLMALMFIGGGPCSTAGGVKSSTVGLAFLMAYSRVRGRKGTTVFEREVPASVTSRAMIIILVASLVISAFFCVLLLLQGIGSGAGDAFVKLLFESVSAFGTVGLSAGATGTLTTGGKLLVSMLMFVGRIGPLSLVVALAGRQGRSESARAGIDYPRESLLIG